MKKTIIALMALACAANADTIWTTGFTVANDGSWALSEEDTTVLSSQNWDLTKADGTDLSSTAANAAELRPNTNVGTAQGWSLDFTLENPSGKALTLNSLTFDTLIFAGTGGYQGTDTNRDFMFTLTYGEQSVSTGNWTIEGNGAATPGNGVVTIDLGAGVELGVGESLDITFEVAKGTSNPGCFLGLKSISAAGTVSAPAVPEPTTATLSLLALAGLAARRCRK